VNYSLEELEAEYERLRYNRIEELFPADGPLRRELYTKHLEFFADGATRRERLFRAANRAGKTEAGAYEVALHLTGKYPDWWVGKRFTKPVNALVAGETGKLVRDSIQEKLLGSPADWGTGLIPRDCILEQRPRAGIADAADIVRVQHVNGVSTLQFQSYDQGREAFQATARDIIWLDEEPPLSIYTEALTRTMTTKGIVMTTFTPLKGMSETVQFLDQKAKDGKISLITATWDDAPHLSEEDKEEMMNAMPPYMRDARSKGVPSLGSGAIYPVPEYDITVTPFEIPKHWKHVYGMDVGWNNTAAVFAAIDPDSQIVYITSDYKRGQAEPAIHAQAIKDRAKGESRPGVIDPAAKGRSQADGQQLIQIYRQLGLNLIEADNGVESGIYEVWQMLSTGKLKVFSTCRYLLEEYRVYRRDEKGRVVKEHDHVMDALRYLIVTGRTIARAEMVSKHDPYKTAYSGTSWMAS
jgi:phage terminase large subunit-like protein